MQRVAHKYVRRRIGGILGTSVVLGCILHFDLGGKSESEQCRVAVHTHFEAFFDRILEAAI